MTVYESEIPGVGHKFELELDGEERLVVIIHHDGKRELYRRPSPNEDSVKLASLTGKKARQLGSILEGAYFQPVEMDDLNVPLGESIIEWVEVKDGSSLVGQTLQEAEIRQRTGVSIIAIQRGEETISNPSPDTSIDSGDLLVAIGTREEQAELSDLLTADEEGN
ncbi:potassium/proton antiporter regulatory subunit, CPA2 family [Haladaptatus litoreus]|uniref:Potassium/proton antiporter regulatory subunit, CPA2 family n=1 Tax=Haladaptatus litoreus TaxID=553468 RepID=A0A1N6USC0_9EURY|nr:TrkA C-terminal domain-containing protein [Haladaptatus litoreus]SIQ68392.1 potassium/proton antiporter regulatory subunit, CPA2 family [Haladaptatus litoreus]